MDSKNKPVVLYMHAGSGNHGCEAIANSIIRMLDTEVDLISYYADEDNKYTLKDMCHIVQEKSFNKHKFSHVLYYVYRKLTHDKESFIRFRFGQYLKKYDQSDVYPVAVSIGGDNYCYDVMLNDLFLANGAFNHQGTKTVLLGCSIEPDLVSRNDICTDLKKYHSIIARESITYSALKESLKDSETKIYCIPDPAFTLRAKDSELPHGFLIGNTIGINISPMIQDNEHIPGITMDAYKVMMQHILDTTDMSIALIPHVVWDRNNDMKPINELKNYFDELGFSNRVIKIDDADAEILKGIISKCRMFIGARTHSTIAAYSTCVPTLVVGYSVKARGIATDLFNGYKVDDLVYPVQKLSNKDDLKNAYIWLANHEDELRDHLKAVMPSYIERAYEAAKVIKEIN